MRNLGLLVVLVVLASCGRNGKQGQDGSNGQDGLNGTFEGQVEHVEVCNDTNLEYVETLVFIDGQYMAFMSSKDYKKQRLVLLEENVLYITTDSRKVNFTIIDGEIICEDN